MAISGELVRDTGVIPGYPAKIAARIVKGTLNVPSDAPPETC
jgi:hypothetical protein